MHSNRVLLADVETDGFLYILTRIHCISLEDLTTGEIWEFSERDGNIGEALFMLATADTIIFHNGVEFDLPAIEKCYPEWETTATIRDTLIMSRLLWANRRDLDMKLVGAGTIEGKMMGRHSLASWGQRLGEIKGDFSEWCEERGIDPWGNWGWEGTTVIEPTKALKDSYEDWCLENGVEVVLNEGVEGAVIQNSVLYQMRIDYCTQDVSVLRQLANLIIDTIELRDMPEFPTWLEHRFTDIMFHARADGFYLDIPRCESLYAEITVHLDAAHKACEEAFPAKWCAVTSGMTYGTFSAKAKVLVDKQQVRIDKAALKDKEIKTTDYKNLLQPMFDLLYRTDGEVNDDCYGAVKIAARSSNVTFKFPKGIAVKGVDPDENGISKLRYAVTAGTCSTPIHYKSFNPNSRQQIIEKLMELGWEPEKYTDAGNPSTEGDILQDAADLIPIAKPIGIGLKCTKIRGYIKSPETKKEKTGWLDVVDSFGFIHPRTIHIGAVTHRTSVKQPNISQIPSINMDKDKSIIMGYEGGWGYECRECFIVPPTWWLMGTDLSGIEIRLFAEELAEFDDGEYIAEVLDGDIHTKNQLAAGLDTRDDAKTFLYSCVPMDTLCLTEKGWKMYNELEVGELVMTYNQKDNVKEWKPILEKVYYEDAEVIEMSHAQSFKVKSTPNHRWFVRKRRRKGDHRRPYMVDAIETTAEINTESNIINNVPIRDNRELIPYDFGRVNDKPKYEIDWLAEILKMSVPEMKAFLAGFMVADGHYQYGNSAETNGHWQWSQNTGNIQEAALMATYLVHDGRVHVSTRNDTPSQMKIAHLNNKGHTTGQRLKKVQLPNQPVWCIRTENESFVMRQGDCITITGNTLYGIGDLKLGEALDSSLNTTGKKKLGKGAKNKFFRAIPAAKKVIKKYERQAKSGYIVAIDGRRVPCDSGHKALNSRLQNAGAIIAKLWTIYVYDEMTKLGYECGYDGDFVLGFFVHDELQIPCRTEEIAHICGKIAMEQSLRVGEFFGITIPIASAYKVGKSWAETH